MGGAIGSGRSVKVLVVEDDKKIAELIRFTLTKNGYQCDTVHNGRSALGILKTQNFDLVLLDTSLPDISGVDVLKIIKQNDILKHIKIVLMTASVELDFKTATKYGALDYWRKPLSMQDLLSRIRKYTEG